MDVDKFMSDYHDCKQRRMDDLDKDYGGSNWTDEERKLLKKRAQPPILPPMVHTRKYPWYTRIKMWLNGEKPETYIIGSKVLTLLGIERRQKAEDRTE